MCNIKMEYISKLKTLTAIALVIAGKLYKQIQTLPWAWLVTEDPTPCNLQTYSIKTFCLTWCECLHLCCPSLYSMLWLRKEFVDMATEDLLLLTTAAHPEIESYWRLRDQKLCNSEVCLCLSLKSRETDCNYFHFYLHWISNISGLSIVTFIYI